MTTTAIIEISRLPAETFSVPLVGTAPLIINRVSEKARRMMLDAMQGRKSPKGVKDPEGDYQAAFYRTKEGYGFPAIAFKAATVGAARFYGKSVTMTALRQFIFMHGIVSPNDTQALVEIEGEPVCREDVVTVGMNGKDLRYRPMFPEWATTLTVTYITSMLTRDSVVSLIDAGGMGVGVGEWRPERRGDFGTYQVDPTRDIEVLS